MKKNLLILLVIASSAAMLTVIQAPFSLSFLAWFALVPFIMACSPEVKAWRLFLTAYLVALCYWLGNIYWMYQVTPGGWIAFCMYTGLLWPIMAVCLRYCRGKKIPLFLAVPVLIVGAEHFQGFLLGGFFWRFLAHSQYANITLIQIADIFGAAGVSFLIAMVNGLAAELIIAAEEKKIFKIGNLLKAALVGGALAGAVIYGRYRINESDKYIKAGPLVAAVQTTVPQSVKKSHQSSEEILDGLLKNSRASIEAGTELVVWPETMVQATLDKRILNRITDEYDCKTVDKILREHSKGKVFVLAGAYGGTLKIGDDFTFDLAERYNSAFLYKPDGTAADEQYSKIHLVAFGEYIPFKKSFPPLYNLLMKFTPYDYDYTLDAGSEYTVFEMTGKEKQVYKFSVMICYEDAVPAIARRFAIDEKGGKNIDWLVNISNDGWFVRFANGKISPSTELGQHAAICVFRAVENRLAVVRSVNTGISCLIDTVGRIRNGYIAGTLPHQAMARTGMAGWFADRVPIDKRSTFFSRYGQWLDFCCAVCFVLLMIMPSLGRFLFREGQKNKNRKAKG
ncbi:MAG: apolipoprotein N-acyltransferase [Phycisphaerae bacterium]|nr:apolipoprotein N-acyltransferase [Phycisphaerae bacterium]MDD5381560.1 apolipoprotein N-acyltransferase [Phycisphaerae bacterium]